MRPQRQGDRGIGAPERYHGDRNAARHKEGGEEPPRVPHRPVKTEHERREVDQKREHPEERDHGDILAKLVRHRQQKDRCRRRQKKPEGALGPGNRRSRGGSRRVLTAAENGECAESKRKGVYTYSPGPGDGLHGAPDERLHDERIEKKRAE
jgi:hypothetical protein